MKNTRYLKIATIALSCLILVAGIIGISASATGADASAEFVNVTLNYGAETRIAYALSIDGANASDVTLSFMTMQNSPASLLRLPSPVATMIAFIPYTTPTELPQRILQITSTRVPYLRMVMLSVKP